MYKAKKKLIVATSQVTPDPGHGLVTSWHWAINTLRQRQNGCHFADIFKCFFLNENFRISNKLSLKYVAQGLIANM